MSIFSKLGLKREKTLYFPGCISQIINKNIQRNYEQILKNLNINYITIPDTELCCGSPVLNAGYLEDFERLMNKNTELFKNFGVKKIITNCPACHKVFSQDYNIEAEHITQTIWNNIESLKLKEFDEEVAYHDPCFLGRHSNIYEEPRYILKALGFKIREFDLNRENSFCCGAHGNLKAVLPLTATRIAEARLRQTKAKRLITTCPLCYLHLKESALTIKVFELSEVLV